MGLPNVGKSTIFNALTSAGAAVANYPFCTIEANVGIVVVDDPRLAEINQFVHTKKITPTTMEFVDIAGLVKGASQGEGLGNQFLARISEVDAIAHIVRCFDDPEVVHVDGRVDPVRDAEIINAELILRDIAQLEKWIDANEKAARGGDPKMRAAVDRIRALRDEMLKGVPARAVHIEEGDVLRKGMNLLTDKAVLYVANVGEADTPGKNAHASQLRGLAEKEGARFVLVCGKLEEEISQLEPAERAEFLKSAGLDEPGLSRLVRAGYDLLGLITYFTAGEKEIRAWTVARGTNAPRAAGRIHSDIERGFIAAEVIPFEDYVRCGGEQGAKAQGRMRLEGREYKIQDGDIILFRFNV